MFWENFIKLCSKRNIKPNPLAKELGISSGAVTKWKKEGTIPNRVTLQKIADYFDVTVDYLLNDSEETTSFTKFEERIIFAYRQHPEHQASINALLGISPADNVTKLQSDTKQAFIAAASGNEYKANEPDAKTIIEIEKLQKKHNK